jgi:choloylglycine hydrolase
MRSVFSAVAALVAAVSISLPAFACTDFQIKTSRDVVIIGRSMEWGADLQSRLVVHPENEQCTSRAPGGKPGLKWTSKLGYVGVDANGLDTSLDGMNEKGLSFGLLWLPEYTKYQDVAPDQTDEAIDLTDLGAWILGNFETVDEVKTALTRVRVCASVVPSFGGVPTGHVALHDAHGNSLVVEFVDGQQKIYDNPIGVMTNSPTFDWHLTNLKNYLLLRADNAAPVKVAGTILSPPGQGSGFLGIPGDWTPPSRFVRTAAMLAFASKVATPQDGVNLTEHILNAVDIPRGTIREKIGGVDYTDYTQWALIKDLSDRHFYFRSYENLSLRMLDLKKLDFSPTAKRRYVTIGGGQSTEEITAR